MTAPVAVSGTAATGPGVTGADTPTGTAVAGDAIGAAGGAPTRLGRPPK